MMDHWKQEGEYKFNEALPTPEKRRSKSQMAKVHLLEVEAKRRRLELERTRLRRTRKSLKQLLLQRLLQHLLLWLVKSRP
jgi:hypothetical protein